MKHTPLKVGAGRVLTHNGVALYSLHRCGTDSDGYAVAPWEADEACHAIARCVNSHDALVEALRDCVDAITEEVQADGGGSDHPTIQAHCAAAERARAALKLAGRIE